LEVIAGDLSDLILSSKSTKEISKGCGFPGGWLSGIMTKKPSSKVIVPLLVFIDTFPSKLPKIVSAFISS